VISKLYSKGIPDLRWRGFRFVVNPKRVNKRIISSIFFGFYESAEVRFIHKYFNGETDVVELGGSLGIVSAHIGSMLHSNKKLFIVEPNPELIAAATQNVSRYCKGQFELVNAALCYSGQEAALSISTNNTASQLVNGNGASNHEIRYVETITLSKLIKGRNLKEYSLVCDIEGAEVDFLINDHEALQCCREILIELHDTSYNGKDYSVSDLANLILQQGFKRIHNEGPVFLFRKENCKN